MKRLNEEAFSKQGKEDVPKLNLGNLDKVDQRSMAGSMHDQLSVMGQPKDIKENAFSQVSAHPFQKEASLTSNRLRKEDNSLFSKKDAKKQLNLINLTNLPPGAREEATDPSKKSKS
mmetsp:Transcript_42285/g.64827  ORF Transcript_42285/g.64827 Transcript_42285/m.64827 type:complete len:117 (-) Transcript_42285:469-819(-)